MMRFELGLEKPNPRRAVRSAGTIAGSYIAGGFIPLGPYVILPTTGTALTISAITTLSCIDRDTGQFLAPSAEQQARIVTARRTRHKTAGRWTGSTGECGATTAATTTALSPIT